MGNSRQRVRTASLNLGNTPVMVIQVPSYVVHNPAEANRLSSDYALAFPDASIILVGLSSGGPAYFGDRRLTSLLRRVPKFHIHWQDRQLPEAQPKPKIENKDRRY